MMAARKDNPNRSEIFSRLLSGAINSIATYEGRTSPIIEDELGQLLTLSGKTIQRYKAGYLPPEHETVKVLAEAAIRRGFLGREWLQRFLHAARYPFADQLLNDLCPAPQARSRPPRVYENLPAPTYSQFVMRQQAFAEAIEGLNQRSAVVLIVGLGGNGKTSLAREVAACSLHDDTIVPRFDAVVWISDKDRPGTTNLTTVHDEIARTLGYPGITQLGYEEKKREIEQLLKQQRVLVVVDNFETITDSSLPPWLLRLPEPSKALITTREYNRIFRRNCWPLDLRGMTDDESIVFIHQRLHVLHLSIHIDRWDALIEATGGNPKAIEIALGLIKYERTSLYTVLDNLYAARGEIFLDLFSRSWSIINEEAQLILMAATFFTADFSIEALRSTSNIHSYTFDSATEILVDLSLLDVQYNDAVNNVRYTLHPLVRAFARNKINERHNFEYEARIRWCDFFLNFVSIHLPQNNIKERYWNTLAVTSNITLIDQEWLHLSAVLEWADNHRQIDTLRELMVRLVHYMARRTQFALRLKYSQKIAETAKQEGNYWDEAIFRIDACGWMLIETGCLDKAVQEITQGLCPLRELAAQGVNVGDLWALAHLYLARIEICRKDLTSAQAVITEALLQPTQPSILHRALMIAGEIVAAQGKCDEAHAYYEKALNLEVDYSDQVPNSLDHYLLRYSIGRLYLDEGDLDSATASFSLLLSIKQHVIATIYGKYGLACVAKQRGEYITALQICQEVLDELSRLRVYHRLIDNIQLLLDELRESDVTM